METAILILPKLNEKVNVQKLKQEIHEYVGNRLVKEEPEEMPGLVIRDTLEEEDKKAISEMSSAAFIFFEYDEENHDNIGDYLTVEL